MPNGNEDLPQRQNARSEIRQQQFEFRQRHDHGQELRVLFMLWLV